MIRIGFDGRALVSPAAGVRRYVRELFGAMARLDGVAVVAVGAPSGADVPRGVERAAGAPSLPTNGGWMLTGLPVAARRARLELFHAPSYTSPLAGPRPLVLTIHDVSYERHPEWYPYRRDPVRRAFYRWSAHAADRVITDSAFSRDEMVTAYGLAPERIDVVPLAASPVFVPAPSGVPDGSVHPFILHVGDLHPRRNVETALRGLMRVRSRRPDLAGTRLVLAGVDRGAAGSLEAVAAGTSHGSTPLEILGRTTEKDLIALYRSARALVYPSLYEGFGLPLLEAMACGTPVIAARTSSIPEVTGDAARLVEPHDEAAWADAIESVFDSYSAAGLRESGLARAAQFTWRRTAVETLAAYRRALGAQA